MEVIRRNHGKEVRRSLSIGQDGQRVMHVEKRIIWNIITASIQYLRTEYQEKVPLDENVHVPLETIVEFLVMPELRDAHNSDIITCIDTQVQFTDKLKQLIGDTNHVVMGYRVVVVNDNVLFIPHGNSLIIVNSNGQ